MPTTVWPVQRTAAVQLRVDNSPGDILDDDKGKCAHDHMCPQGKKQPNQKGIFHVPWICGAYRHLKVWILEGYREGAVYEAEKIDIQCIKTTN